MKTEDKLERAHTDGSAARQGDSLAVGLIFMFVLMVVQRLIGLGRSLLFCHGLDDYELGQWSLVYSFLLLGAPLVVFGLPACFGRYVEHYRQRSQLRLFLRRTAIATLLLGLLAAGTILRFREQVATLIFKDPQLVALVHVFVIALLAALTYNFLVELVMALRQVRALACIHFLNSLLFALISVGILAFTTAGPAGIVLAYSASCLLASLPAAWLVLRAWREAPDTARRTPQRTFWFKLLPFAVWLWLMDIVMNTFDVVDRWMLVQFSSYSPLEAQALVGQYHTSRMIPILLIAIAEMIAGVLLPYLSAEWEKGDRRSVSRQVNLALKMTGIAFTFIGVGVMVVFPRLFEFVVGDRYALGLQMLPLTLSYCVWMSLAIVALTYVWCAERARSAVLAASCGLLINVALNAVLVPTLGLLGAILATNFASVTALVSVLVVNRKLGMSVERGTWLICLLPVTLALGWLAAITGLIAIGFAATRGSLILSEEDQQLLQRPVTARFARVKLLLIRRKTASA